MHLFMFADDTKYLKSVESIYDVAHIQCDTDSLFDWSRNGVLSLIILNVSICIFLNY